MVSAAAEASDALMDKHRRRATLMRLRSSKGCVFGPSPVKSSRCAAAPLKQRVQRMLDAVIELMPSPLDVPAIDGVDEKGSMRSVIQVMKNRFLRWRSN